MAIKIDVDVSGINEIVNAFNKMPGNLEKARNSAMAEVRDKTQGFIIKQILKEYNLEKSVLEDKLKDKTKISKDKLGITFYGKGLNPMSFKDTSPNVPPSIDWDESKRVTVKTPMGYRKIHRRIPYEIKVKVKKGKSKTLETNVGDNGASYFPFIMKTGAKSENKMPYFIALNKGYKKNNGKSVVTGMKTVSIPQMILNKNISSGIQEKMIETFMKRFAHQAYRFKAITAEQKYDFYDRNNIKIRGR